MDFNQLTITDIVLLSVFCLTWLFQLLFLLIRIRPFAFQKAQADGSASLFLPKVSVIICAKNEAENLQKFLPSVLTQDYPDYQVVVVNDCSEDDSEMVLARLKQQHPRLYYTTIPFDRRYHHGKKLALTIGVKAAVHNYLVFTDADCQPAGDQWLKTMMQGFASPEKRLILGFGGYLKKKGFLNFLIRYDTFYVAMQYMGFALSKKPYMGVGRNLAYTKELFIKNNGLKSHSKIASGDDDLFVQETATALNTAVVSNPAAHTYSIPPNTFRNWRLQKARHLTTSPFYKWSVKFELLTDALSREIFWALGILLIFFNTFALVVGALMLINLILKLIFWGKAAQKLQQGRIYWGFLIFDFWHPWFLFWAQTANLFRSNKNKWK